MSEPSRSAHWRDEIDSWYKLVFRIALGTAGLVIAIAESLWGGGRLGVLATAAAMMGPVVAASMAQVIQAARGGGRDR